MEFFLPVVMKMDEQKIIVAFVDHLATLNDRANLSVDRWPDKENRTRPEIDAIAGNFAIEHTSIDSVVDQRKLDAWFLEVIQGLDQVIKDHVDCGFSITLDYYAIGKGMDWSCIREAIRRWIVNSASTLENGEHEITLPTSTQIEFPIVMRVNKCSVPHIVGFSRFEPEDNTLPSRIRRLLDRKAEKLKVYQGRSFRTMILLENDDISLMEESKMLAAFREAYRDRLPQGVNEIWFVHNLGNYLQFCDFTAKI